MKNDEFLVKKSGDRDSAIVHFRHTSLRFLVTRASRERGERRGEGGVGVTADFHDIGNGCSFVYPPGCGASSNGWNWNIALKPWPGHSELATNSTYRSDPVLSTSTSAPWLHSIAIVAAPESVPSCTLIKSALFRQL